MTTMDVQHRSAHPGRSVMEEAAVFFESFNAKYLEPSEVALGYVYSEHLAALAGQYHVVLTGPRGSGKTTLLKMLQPQALNSWQGKKAASFRNQVKYSGIFISSDISWSRQLSALGYGRLSGPNHKTLVLACFTTHVVHSVVQAMIARSTAPGFRSVKLSVENESALSRQFAELLRLSPALPTLLSVKQSLRMRLSQIRVIANQGSLDNQDNFTAKLMQLEYLHLDFLDVSATLTTLFNDCVFEEGAKWALLFDELETAPDWIVEQLFAALRVDTKVILKLAISPVSPTAHQALSSHDGPAETQDYRQVKLWYSDRVNARAFCEAIWKSLTGKVGINVSAREALGASAFEPAAPGDVRHKNPYAPGEYWARTFASLSAKDRSFAAFLKQKNISLEQLGRADQQTKDTVLRRAAPIAAVRDFYLHEDLLGNVSPRRRKTSVLFAGAESIFAISEGNPRWLIGLLTPLISYMVRERERRVPQEVQAEEINNAADRLLALLRTIPVPPAQDKFDAIGLHHIVERIGTKLHEELVDNNFSLDPKLSFTVDIQTPSSTMELLSAGLNRGAVMLVSTAAAGSVVKDTSGATLRLSYLLAARFGLPLRKGKSTNLSHLLRPKSARPDSSQIGIEGI
jgi:hypothetical protein